MLEGYRLGRPATTITIMRTLLFAGFHDSPRGGAADLVGWFECEADGRAAFHELRATTSDDEGWAELVGLDGRAHRPQMLAWFGRHPSSPRGHHPAGRGRRHLRLVVR